MTAAKEVRALNELMPPPPPRAPKRKKIVLDEDEYVAQLGMIIERDFFPDIPVLKSQLRAWERLDGPEENPTAVTPSVNETPATLGGATGNIASCCGSAGTSVLDSVHPKATGDYTPLLTRDQSVPVATPLMEGPDTDVDGAGAGLPVKVRHGESIYRSLDVFLSSCTSEDNASFEELQQDATKRKKLKHAHYLEDKNRPLELDGPSATDGYGTTGQRPDTAVQWRHVPKNRLYYDPSETGLAAYSSKELSQRVHGPPKQVRHENTRFQGANGIGSESPSKAFGGTHEKVQGEGTPYSFLATPSPAPGMQESPLMTWGELGSTPIRLEGDATPFRVQALPPRDRLGQVLAHEAGKSLKRRKASKAGVSLALSKRTPKALSAAGRKLASALKSKTPNTDLQLRASYLGTQPRPWSVGTPLRTPRNRVTGRCSGQEPESKKESITDDLLDI